MAATRMISKSPMRSTCCQSRDVLCPKDFHALAPLLQLMNKGGEGDCMKLSNCLILLMMGTLAGCASAGGGPPVAVAEVSEAEAALRSAEEAGAAEQAPELFEEARIALAAARRASGEEARQRLLE